MPDFFIHPASFRDPSGFVFKYDSKFYRQVNKAYAADYDLLMHSGLYEKLSSQGLLISHIEANDVVAERDHFYKTLLPLQIDFVSYPFEWTFSQLKDAALLTIQVLKTSLDHGMILKDATPYNIQVIGGKPVFIDTLSFEKYDAGKAWVAYRQFCTMFLFPLYLEHYLKTDLQKTLLVYPDGIPIDTTSRLLPLKSRARLGVWLHVYLQNTVSRTAGPKPEVEKFNRKKLLNLIQHLEKTISDIKSRVSVSAWNRYYDETISGNNYLQEKETIFRWLLTKIDANTALDVGANNGHFSKILAEHNLQVVAIDSDSASVNALYEEVKAKRIANILPLVIDIANPSPAAGFQNSERPSFLGRINPGLTVALGLVHHLVIGRNIPLPKLAQLFADISPLLIIEFIPRNDEKVVQMLASRKDVFLDYTCDNFESAFSQHFIIKELKDIPGSPRTIYLMEKR